MMQYSGCDGGSNNEDDNDSSNTSDDSGGSSVCKIKIVLVVDVQLVVV